MAIARRNHDHFLAEAWTGAQLGLDIGANAATDGRVESADVGDTHRRVETGRAGEVQVKLC
jgi:hypothetical protein